MRDLVETQNNKKNKPRLEGLSLFQQKALSPGLGPTLLVVHNCRNEAINITKSDFFYNYFLICIPKFCIDQAIKVTKNDFFDFLTFECFGLFCSSQF